MRASPACYSPAAQFLHTCLLPLTDDHLARWDTLAPHNVQNCPAELRKAVTSLSQPVVVSFFASWCSGCRRLHPKLMQIAAQNPDVTFLKVSQHDCKTPHTLNWQIVCTFLLHAL